jgi:hypothetical protein
MESQLWLLVTAVVKSERVAVTRLPTALVVTLMVGFPVVPVAFSRFSFCLDYLLRI